MSTLRSLGCMLARHRGKFTPRRKARARMTQARRSSAVLGSTARAHLALTLCATDEPAATGAVGGGGAIVAAGVVGHLVAAVGALHAGHGWRARLVRRKSGTFIVPNLPVMGGDCVRAARGRVVRVLCERSGQLHRFLHPRPDTLASLSKHYNIIMRFIADHRVVIQRKDVRSDPTDGSVHSSSAATLACIRGKL